MDPIIKHLFDFYIPFFNFEKKQVIVMNLSISNRGGDEIDEEEAVFRKWFRHVGEFRSLHPSATVLALSATCTKTIKKRVMKVLGLNINDTKFVTVSPDKPNIKLCARKIDQDIASAMYWLVSAANFSNSVLPKILIYCKSIADVANIYFYLHSEFDNKNVIEMFHSETTVEKKKYIIDELSKSDSEMKVIVATSALGMGIDIKSCHSVIMYGPPSNVVDLVQELGRVGRDGQQSCATVLFNCRQLRHVDKDVKLFLENNDCRRRNILAHFLDESDLLNLAISHDCCDICETKCNCGECKKGELENLPEIEEFVECEDALEGEDKESGSETDVNYDEFSDDDCYVLFDNINI